MTTKRLEIVQVMRAFACVFDISLSSASSVGGKE